MTPKERVIRALRHQETDYLPYTVDLCGDTYEKMLKHCNGENFMYGVEQHVVKSVQTIFDG